MTAPPISRLAYEKVEPSLRPVLEPIVDRLGYFGEFFQYAAHAPDVLSGFMAYTAAIKAALTDRINELIALTVCTALDCAYERVQHERLALRLGFDRAWIAALVGSGDVSALDDADRAVRALALAVAARDERAGRSALAAVATEFGEAAAIGMLFQITRFMTICSIGRLLDIALPVGSIFDE